MEKFARSNASLSLSLELEEFTSTIRTSFKVSNTSLRRSTTGWKVSEDEDELQEANMEILSITTPRWSRLSNLQTPDRRRSHHMIDLSKLGLEERRMFVQNLIKDVENDNLRLLKKQRERMDRVGVKQPTIEVQYKNVHVEARCSVVDGKPLPTLWNTVKESFQGLADAPGLRKDTNIYIMRDVSGIIKPSRMTLLLGPPGCGKTTFLLALAGKLAKSLKVNGEISYNGFKLNEFVPERTSAYISQYDIHIPEMTVRETLDFSARFQGTGSRTEILKQVIAREKELGIVPDPEIEAYMKLISGEGKDRTLQTEYIMKILGLEICADTMVGDAMRRGISGGQKKRLTTGEMIIGPNKALFMDEISTGLDSSTTFQIVTCLQHFCHVFDSTVVISLLQPAPETYNLFDDIILMAEGKIVYHGPRSSILDFFEECGFRCPERKGAADFLQEVLSRKDQAQYWWDTSKHYSYVSVDEFSKKFKAHEIGQKLDRELSIPFDKSLCHNNALSFSIYSMSRMEFFKACIAREWLLMKRNSFVYIFKISQLTIAAMITMTMFFRTRMKIDLFHAGLYMGSVFFTLVSFNLNGLPELTMTIFRLPVFYKQRDMCFYPAWAYAIPSALLKVPISFAESLIWTSLTYYVIGYSPEAKRFVRQMLMLFAIHQMSMSLFRFVASYYRTLVKSIFAASIISTTMLLFGGFILPEPSMPAILKWGFWVSPLTYAEIGLTGNEFLAHRWQKVYTGNTTLGNELLNHRGLNYSAVFYWISLGAVFGFIVLFNIMYIVALTHKRSVGNSRAIISKKTYDLIQGKVYDIDNEADKNSKDVLFDTDTKTEETCRKVMPFVPLAITFQDVQYYVEAPQEMKDRGYREKRLQLLHDITGAFRPDVLTALMGVSGAGKTTLLDVLSGRKTGGIIEGDIRIGGYLKVQDTFARISGYCEQHDVHSPQITVIESVQFSAWLRLPPEVDPKTRHEFVNEVLENVELNEIKDNLVGQNGINGLSTEQRKRLTIAVELVSNPSIIFMDEPTSGLDARSAAIVMRAVKNVSDTGRTVVCTIHQPSIQIFEAFNELILLKRGGEMIYYGQIGWQSRGVTEYFKGIAGIPHIKDDYNPATWMLEVTSPSMENQIGIDFAQKYQESELCRGNQKIVQKLSTPAPGSVNLHFPTTYPRNIWVQFKACLWKQYLSYWRSPTYNLKRILYVAIQAILFAGLFWKQGKIFETEQNLFSILGSMYVVTLFTGINNCSSVMQFVATERAVFYRERFAGMYSSFAYSTAQVLIEIPYVLAQATLLVGITYPAIGYYGTASKFIWFSYTIFCTLLYFVYLGMFLVSLTPSVQVASILGAFIYQIINLFSGFLLPGTEIPAWWIWLYYINPLSWTLKGLFTSQYGNVAEEVTVFENTVSVSDFLEKFFGFHRKQLTYVACILMAFPIIFASLFACCIQKLNFQRS